ncbi:GNAT family N-acetyltransferase [Paenibacillus paridis]|uniref:GNAT family N-acetyltransferase n=1 Tax=Paenibacillus paridis TaxID=2583376 RepID=UPI00111D785E|nr:GNAT family N-acetyltransferase [Paenibacillus paridis]
MSNSVELVKPSVEYKDEYMSFYKDWKSSEQDITPWVVEKDPSDFNAMIDFLYSEDTEEKITNLGFVPHSTYWLIDKYSKKVIGAVNIRHKLNAKLHDCGGHIGYGIRPSERRKGYAFILLALTLEITKNMGLNKVLLVCDNGNIASEKTIIKNGGQFESEFIEESGNVVRRFWIQL